MFLLFQKLSEFSPEFSFSENLWSFILASNKYEHQNLWARVCLAYSTVNI